MVSKKILIISAMSLVPFSVFSQTGEEATKVQDTEAANKRVDAAKKITALVRDGVNKALKLELTWQTPGTEKTQLSLKDILKHRSIEIHSMYKGKSFFDDSYGTLDELLLILKRLLVTTKNELDEFIKSYKEGAGKEDYDRAFAAGQAARVLRANLDKAYTAYAAEVTPKTYGAYMAAYNKYKTEWKDAFQKEKTAMAKFNLKAMKVTQGDKKKSLFDDLIEKGAAIVWRTPEKELLGALLDQEFGPYIKAMIDLSGKDLVNLFNDRAKTAKRRPAVNTVELNKIKKPYEDHVAVLNKRLENRITGAMVKAKTTGGESEFAETAIE
jgi:hypothetical protein